MRAGEVGCAAGEIAGQLGIPPATLTFHLKELSHAGLIDSRREGRSIRYFVRISGIRELLTYLMHDCCNGQPELFATSRFPAASEENCQGEGTVSEIVAGVNFSVLGGRYPDV